MGRGTRCVPKAAAAAAAAAAAPPLESFFWLAPMKQTRLPPAAPRVARVNVTAADRATVVLESERTAAFVSVASLGVAGAFDDGAFALLAGDTRTLDFTARVAGTAQWAGFEAGLRVRSLVDTL